MSKHTPGPWHQGRYEVQDDKGALVANLSGWRGEQQTLANARLIAATPENYASNKELAAIVRELCRAYGHPLPEASLFRSDAAIAKAEAV